MEAFGLDPETYVEPPKLNNTDTTEIVETPPEFNDVELDLVDKSNALEDET